MGKTAGTEGTPEPEVIDELAPQTGRLRPFQHRWKAPSPGPALDVLLRGQGLDTILLTGGATDIGILSDGLRSPDLGYHLVILGTLPHAPR